MRTLFFYKRQKDLQLIQGEVFAGKESQIRWFEDTPNATLLVHVAYCTGWRANCKARVVFARNATWEDVEMVQGMNRVEETIV